MKRSYRTRWHSCPFNVPNREDYQYRVERINPKSGKPEYWGFYHTPEQAQSAADYANQKKP